VNYSQETHELQFDGFMSKTDFDKLIRLHGDVGYQRALEQLFQTCTFQASSSIQRTRGQPVLLAGLATAALIATMVWAIAAWW
jgi:hypothetical protein